MLVKVGNNEGTTSSTITASTSSDVAPGIATYTMPRQFKHTTLTLTMNARQLSGNVINPTRVILLVGGTQIYDTGYGADGTKHFYYDNLPGGTEITVQAETGSSTWSISASLSIEGKYYISNRKLIPNEIELIGNKTFPTSYGLLDNGTRYGEIGSETSSSYTTGDITLGNAQGFVILTLSDGRKVKIPYYGN